MAFGFHLSVIIVAKKMKNLSRNTIKAKLTSVIKNAKRNLLRSYPLISKIPTGVSEKKEKANKSTIGDMSQVIKKEYPILRQSGMHNNAMLKAHTLWGNGKNSKRNVTTNVLSVVSEGNLLKTISSHYQKVAQITSQTFNHYAVIVIAKSGSIRQDYFNIWKNPELLKGQDNG